MIVLVSAVALILGASLPSLASGRHSHAGGASRAGTSPARTSPAIASAAHEVLVRFRAGTAGASMAAADRAAGGTVRKTFTAVPNLRLVRLASGVTVDAALASYRLRSDVSYAEPNRIWGLADAPAAPQTPLVTTPNDPLFTNQWDWNNTGQTGGTADADVDAPEAWGTTTGSSDVVVGVIDTGIDYKHADLVANVWNNAAECNGVAGLDDDANGYIDDCHGIDAINGDSDPKDDFGHGTHTSGTIGAVGDNAKGVTGLNWHVTILPCKSHDASGNATSASVIECFGYMQMEKERFGLDIVATNNSWGGCPEACGFDAALRDAIAAHQGAGILTIAAAGNSFLNIDSSPSYPASYDLPNVIAVAATTNTDGLASFSNYGARTVGVGAPGQSVFSTWLGSTYTSLSGTSMASPHVAGLAALLKAQDPTRDWRAIRNLILAGGDAKSSVATKTLTGRRLNANGSVNCSNVAVSGIVRPLPKAALGALTIEVLNINCATPAGNLSVTIAPGGKVLSLRDTGTKGDLAKRDGIYSARWTPGATGTYTLTFSNGKVATVQVT